MYVSLATSACTATKPFPTILTASSKVSGFDRRWRLSRLLPACAWSSPARSRCCRQSLLPLSLRVSSCGSPLVCLSSPSRSFLPLNTVGAGCDVRFRAKLLHRQRGQAARCRYAGCNQCDRCQTNRAHKVSPGSAFVFVATAHPKRSAVPLIASFRNDVEIVVGRVHQVDAARVGGIRVEDLPRSVFGEDTQPREL